LLAISPPNQQIPLYEHILGHFSNPSGSDDSQRNFKQNCLLGFVSFAFLVGAEALKRQIVHQTVGMPNSAVQSVQPQ
jgi:hypothetical protein